jgi:hypothetical protein
MGRRRGGSFQTWPPGPISAEYLQSPRSQREEQEIQHLKKQAADMNEKMLGIQERIRQLESKREA